MRALYLLVLLPALALAQGYQPLRANAPNASVSVKSVAASTITVPGATLPGSLRPLTPWGPVTQNLKSPNQNLSDGTSASTTYRSIHPLIVNTSAIRICYSNHSNPTAQTNAITVGASFDYQPNGTAWNSVTPRKVTFNGQDTITLQPEGVACSDPYFGTFLMTGTLYVRTWVSTTGTPLKWPLTGYAANYAYEGILAGDQRTAANYNTTFTHGTSTSYIPALIAGPGAYRPTVAGVGDSIMDGSGDNAFPDVGGFLGRALNGKYGYLRVAEPGETAATAATVGGALDGLAVRGLFAMNTSNVVSNYGTDDDGAGTSASVTEANLVAIWNMFARNGQRVFQTTILPKTTSTDSWATIANQTPATGESARQAINTWLRCGAPLSSGTPVACGTAGALLAGQTGHPLYAVLDTAATVEVNAANVLTLNGGYWKVNGSANYPTTDGTHPSSAMAALIAVPVAAASFL